MTRNDPDQPSTQKRPPMNWPTAVVGVGALLLLAWVAWLCSGAAVDIWGSR